MPEVVAFESDSDLGTFLGTTTKRCNIIYTTKNEQINHFSSNAAGTRWQQSGIIRSQVSDSIPARAYSNKRESQTEPLDEWEGNAPRNERGSTERENDLDAKRFKTSLTHPDALPYVLERGESVHLQGNTCQHKIYNKFNKCKACIRKSGRGDLCRFRGIRVFKQDGEHLSYGPYFYPAPIDDPHMDPTDDTIFDIDKEPDSDVLIKVPNRHRIHSDSNLEKYILRSTAPVLKEILESEFACLNYDPIGRKFLSKPRIAPFLRPTEDKCARHLCDECLTSLFNVHYSCSVCAKEVCRACFEGIPDLIDLNNEEFLSHINSSRRDSLERCLVRGKAHCKSSFLTISKYSLHALNHMYAQVLSVLEKGVVEMPPPSTIPSIDPTRYTDFSQDSQNYTRITPASMNPDDLFEAAWKRGETAVYEGGAGRTGGRWSAEYFIEHFGHEIAHVVDCETKSGVNMPVSDFFRHWIEPSWTRTAILKLPDWPSHSDFKHKFPEHFADFKNAVPFPVYSSFTGALNLVARLPANHLPPDLGPKMYNAFGSSDEGKHGYGTTPIHLDMADAVNVMMFASTLPNACSPPNRPAAVWDIYPRKDLKTLRDFLRAEFDVDASQDPVHDQFYYLDEARREKLYRVHGVLGWRIFQNVGDAVFVPAGCAHQVCNYMDCVKAACDFVSPENLSACVQLTSEFRALSKTHRRREDLLSLRAILWNVWESSPLFATSADEDERDGEDYEDEDNYKEQIMSAKSNARQEMETDQDEDEVLEEGIVMVGLST
ncbi:hypothetical protein BJ741DRAFT_622625 [Chytriomyces cf. hyalinus JEL632]|nr:hypothetical protein BJ741DRAFT_622625 [Chytriomyces cf. hyalinus JEL632]